MVEIAKKASVFGLIVFFLTSCGSSKVTTYKKKSNGTKYHNSSYSNSSSNNNSKFNTHTLPSGTSNKVVSILSEAKSYLGTPYKYGGETRDGLDCSGLVHLAFSKANLDLPRISRDQAQVGKEINLNQILEGDLLFFNTAGSSISHVGIVERKLGDEIFFIHSSTSKGVIVSSLNETYWNNHFVKATRVF